MIESVKIGIHQYSVSEAEDLQRAEDGAWLNGIIHHTKLAIELRETLPRSMKQAALWHECLHGVLFQTGLYLDDTLEEKICVALSHGIVQLLQENPELADYTLGESEAGQK